MDRDRIRSILIFAGSLIFNTSLFIFNIVFLKSDLILSLLYIIPLSLTLWYSSKISSMIILFQIILYYLIIDILYFKDLNFLIIDTFLKIVCFIYIYILLSMRKELYLKEKKNARTDKLTGSLNRFGLYEKLSDEIISSKRFNIPLTVAYIDLDNFKSINDTKGHKEGDKVLITFTSEIEKNIRETDYLSRMGGDEFLIVFPDTDMENSKTVANKLMIEITKMFVINDWNVISLSMGVCTFNYDNIPDFDKIISIVDKKMYDIKLSGKNNIKYYEYK